MFNLVLEATTGEQLLELLVVYVDEELFGHLASVFTGGLLVIGSLLMLLASVGLMRLPDLPTRMHASTKAGSLGAAMIMLAVAVAIPEAHVFARSLAVIAFLLLTAPVAAHVIGRAGYFVGVPLWDGTVKDDLADQYDYDRHTLRSGDFADREIEGYTDTDSLSKPYDSVDPADQARRDGDVFDVDAPTSGPELTDDSDVDDTDDTDKSVENDRDDGDDGETEPEASVDDTDDVISDNSPEDSEDAKDNTADSDNDTADSEESSTETDDESADKKKDESDDVKDAEAEGA